MAEELEGHYTQSNKSSEHNSGKFLQNVTEGYVF
jgi:hypothetical protein